MILYTGSYNAPVLAGDGSVQQGHGEGITLWSFDEDTGVLARRKTYPEAQNASWIALSKDGRTLFAVEELDSIRSGGKELAGGAVASWHIDSADGTLWYIGMAPTYGAAPCHLSVRDCPGGSGGHLYAANYNGDETGGSLMTAAYNADGRIDPESVITLRRRFTKSDLEAEGRDLKRQEKPHIHCAEVYRNWLFVNDLGRDRTEVLRLKEDGEIDRGQFLPLHSPEGCCSDGWFDRGSGPRSIAFGSRYVFVTEELADRICVLAIEKLDRNYAEYGLRYVEEIPAVSPSSRSQGGLGGLVLSPDGRFLYAGSRGDNTIAVFAIREDGSEDAVLRPVQWIESGGSNPRGIALSPGGGWLLAANQDSDNIVSFRRDADSGMLTLNHETAAGAVVCFAFQKGQAV